MLFSFSTQQNSVQLPSAMTGAQIAQSVKLAVEGLSVKRSVQYAAEQDENVGSDGVRLQYVGTYSKSPNMNCAVSLEPEDIVGVDFEMTYPKGTRLFLRPYDWPGRSVSGYYDNIPFEQFTTTLVVLWRGVLRK